jgi:hypothetical protein
MKEKIEKYKLEEDNSENAIKEQKIEDEEEKEKALEKQKQ